MLSRFLQHAPENFLDTQQIRDVRAGRRGFLANALAAATAATVTATAAQTRQGDPNILELPAHSKGLGQPVAARSYGLPSEWEKNL